MNLDEYFIFDPNVTHLPYNIVSTSQHHNQETRKANRTDEKTLIFNKIIKHTQFALGIVVFSLVFTGWVPGVADGVRLKLLVVE